MNRLSTVAPATTAHSVPRRSSRTDVAKTATLSIGAVKPSLLANPSKQTEGAAAPNLSTLPAWANTDEARALLATIIAEQPERSRPLTQLATGQTASFGFAGRAANRLRAIYDRTFDRMLTFVGAVPFDSPEYHCRRNALIAFDKANNADAVIAKAMEASA